MTRISKLIRPVVLMLAVSAVGACGSVDDDWSYYPYDYPWYYTTYGTWSTVRRPVIVVDGWTSRAFRHRPYRRYNIVRRHHSPISYTATRGDATIDVTLTELGDSTRIEVKARRGQDQWDREQAKALMGHILQEYKPPRSAQ
ncbi:MAG TPA: hypothetical protein VK864_10910 [Longimicrobiales bacterium]|nr:hypothetical protein [Longimicrobiales bacterium]